MPYTKRARTKKRNHYRRPYARPQYGPALRRTTWTRRRRVQQNLTRDCRWFKEVRTIQSNDSGNFRELFAPTNIDNCLDFPNWAKIWEEYKVLKVVVKMIPAAVGSESLQENFPQDNDVPGARATFKRGDCITWVDQGDLDEPTTFSRIIIKPSARLIQPRRYHVRWIDRPKGNPNWGRIDTTGIVTLPDEWGDTRIQLFGTRFTPSNAAGNQIWYYVTVAYKVIFRGRQELPDPIVAPVPPAPPAPSPK